MKRYQPFLLFALLAILLIRCSKPNDTGVTPTPVAKSADTLRTGAQVLEKSKYEALPLLKEPLVGARVEADGKDPKLPASYDLTPSMPPVGDQGQEGSCTAWAVAYASRSYFVKVSKNLSYTTTDGKRNDETVSSPAFVYNQINKGEDRGSYISEALDLLQTKGVCTLKDMPYVAGNYKLQPTAEQQQKAAAFKIKKWGRISIEAKAFKRFLYFDYPIVVCAAVSTINPLNPASKANGEYLWKTPKIPLAGFHAMVVIGYDDTRQAFKVQNSWSKDWGNQGFIWLDYDSMPNVILEAYVMVTGESGPTPTIPVIETNGYVWSGTTATLFGTIKELNNAAISRYGFQIAATKEALATSPYQEVKIPVTTVPFPFTLAYPTNGKDTYYYRAFAETPEEFWYGSTATLFQPTVSTKAPELKIRCGNEMPGNNQATLTGELTSLGDAPSFADRGFILVQNSARQKDTNPTIATAPRISLGPTTAIGSFSTVANSLLTNMPYQAYAYVKTGQGVEYNTSSLPSGNTSTCLFATTPGVTYSGNATVHSVSLPISFNTNTPSAFSPKNATLFWVDYWAVYQWKESTKQATVLAGGTKAGSTDGTGTAAGFNDVWAMTTDASGNVYVADNYKYTTGSGGNHQKIRKITPDGVVTTLAGNNSNTQTIPAFTDGKGDQASFREIDAMTSDAQGNLWVIDGSTVRKVTPDGTVTTLCGDPNTSTVLDGSLATARFFRPKVIAVDNAGTVFVVDKNSIRKITASGVTTVAGQLIKDAFIEYAPGQPVTNNFPTAAHYADGTVPSVDFFWPTALLPDNNGNLYVVDRIQTRQPATLTGNFIRKLTSTGQLTTIAGKFLSTTNTAPEGGPATSAQLEGVVGAFMGPGYIVLIDRNQYRVIQAL